MTDHPLPTVRGSYLHYTEHSIDWQSIFDEHELGTPPPSLRSLASKYGIPRATLSDRYRRYAAAKRDKDSEELAIAVGEIDGRRDNHRIFSREEEQELKDQLEEQNLHPNKPIVKALALRIHQEKLESVGPVTRSQGKAASTAQFNASDGWVQREKRKLGMNDHKPVVKKKYKRKKGDDPELRRDRAAIFWDEVEEVVKTYGGQWTINADEVSAKIIKAPRTLWHKTGGPPPILASNHTGKEAFTIIFATTTGGHKLKPAVFVKGKTHASLKSYAELADSVHLVLVSNRWVDQERWEWYILNVIVPFCEGHPAAFVVDSHAPHISPESIALGRKYAIKTIQVPEGQTGELQPNDVGVYGPMTSLVQADWLEGKRTDPDAWDSQAAAVARYLRAWTALSRDTVRSAWVKAVPGLGALSQYVRHQPR